MQKIFNVLSGTGAAVGGFLLAVIFVIYNKLGNYSYMLDSIFNPIIGFIIKLNPWVFLVAGWILIVCCILILLRGSK